MLKAAQLTLLSVRLSVHSHAVKGCGTRFPTVVYNDVPRLELGRLRMAGWPNTVG